MNTGSRSYSLSHLADHVLLRELSSLVTQDRITIATLLAHLAEVDERKLYLPAAHPSMFSYCVRELRMSEDTAFRRIAVARSARQFPALFAALADGRLNLTAVLLLTPHLSQENAVELVAAAAHKTKDELRLLLAERFPQPDVATLVRDLSHSVHMELQRAATVTDPTEQLALERVELSGQQGITAPTALDVARASVAPLSPGRFALQVTVDKSTHDKLRYAQALLGHALPSGDVAEVLDRALDALIHKLEQQKFAKSARSRTDPAAGGVPRGAANGRYVPAEIRRTVWQRDGGQCTFESERGQRCQERTRLEFDHVDPVARGGATTVDRMRLRCRAHNQYAAECTFGTQFMRGKRQGALCRVAKTEAHSHGEAEAQAKAEGDAKRKSEAAASPHDVIPWLRQLGCSAQEARRGAALCAHLPDAPLDQRVRTALRGLAPACVRRAAPVAGSAP
jgi:hypothetical protein